MNPRTGPHHAQQQHERLQMARDLVMEVVREPTLRHLLLVLTDPDYRGLLLLRAQNPDILTYWRGGDR